MVIIEGPDGAGKTTLVKHLSEKFGMMVGARGVANRDFLYKVTRQDTYRALSMAVKADDRPQIWDRLFISEFVYAGTVGRPCEFSDFEARFVLNVLEALTCPVVVCLPPLPVVRENAAREHQMKGVKEGLDKIYEMYATGSLPWPENTLWYDYTGSVSTFATLHDVEEEIEGYIESREERQAWQ